MPRRLAHVRLGPVSYAPGGGSGLRDGHSKIYLAVPDPALNRTVRSHLSDAGHRLQEAMDWGLVPEEVGLFGADVVILASELPDSKAADVIAQLKGDPRTRDRSVVVLLPEDVSSPPQP